jgi:hypothetical protein
MKRIETDVTDFWRTHALDALFFYLRGEGGDRDE